MPKFNIDRIRQIVGEINSSLYRLQEHTKLSEEEFLFNPDKLDSAKYNLLIVIEGAIDICNHVVARLGGRAPCDYADCFAILGELGIFSDEFVEKLKRMAKFRNLLVHLYWQVDNRKVYQALKEHIQNLRAYLQGIEKLITSA